MTRSRLAKRSVGVGATSPGLFSRSYLSIRRLIYGSREELIGKDLLPSSLMTKKSMRPTLTGWCWDGHVAPNRLKFPIPESHSTNHSFRFSSFRPIVSPCPHALSD